MNCDKFPFVSFCSYPLWNIPLPGTIPTKVILPYADQTASLKSSTIQSNSDDSSTASANSSHEQPPFPWANSDPFVYIQQIILRSSVLPWRKNLLLTDAYRGPLHEIFKLLEIVRNHEDESGKTNLANICLHVENVKMPTKYSSQIFPEYNCLILSPANLWQQNAQNFKRDTNLLSTIFHHHVSHLDKIEKKSIKKIHRFISLHFSRICINQKYRLLKCCSECRCVIRVLNDIRYGFVLESYNMQ